MTLCERGLRGVAPLLAVAAFATAAAASPSQPSSAARAALSRNCRDAVKGSTAAGLANARLYGPHGDPSIRDPKLSKAWSQLAYKLTGGDLLLTTAARRSAREMCREAGLTV